VDRRIPSFFIRENSVLALRPSRLAALPGPRTRQSQDSSARRIALDQLVVIGHSQGGMLTRLMVTDSGTRSWDAVTDVPFEKIDVSPETRALGRRGRRGRRLVRAVRILYPAVDSPGAAAHRLPDCRRQRRVR
jgi:hypothetical protein